MYEEIQDPYEIDHKKDRLKDKAEYALAIFLKGIFYIIKLVLKIIIAVILNVLRTFGIKIGSSRESGWA